MVVWGCGDCILLASASWLLPGAGSCGCLVQCHGTEGSMPTDTDSLLLARMLDIAKAMQLTISKAKGLPGLEDDQKHKLATLSLPLPVQKVSEGRRKRKRII